MAKKENMFGSFGAAAADREQEQKQIEAIVTGKEARPELTGRPRKRKDAVNMTISISKEDRETVKAYAYDHAVTVSDLIHTWILLHCKEGE